MYIYIILNSFWIFNHILFLCFLRSLCSNMCELMSIVAARRSDLYQQHTQELPGEERIGISFAHHRKDLRTSIDSRQLDINLRSPQESQTKITKPQGVEHYEIIFSILAAMLLGKSGLCSDKFDHSHLVILEWIGYQSRQRHPRI